MGDQLRAIPLRGTAKHNDQDRVVPSSRFHSAVLIYFHRAVFKEDPGSLGDEVGFILNNLPDAEDLKDQCIGGDKRTVPMPGPAFIASCVASDRLPWAEWWVRK